MVQFFGDFSSWIDELSLTNLVKAEPLPESIDQVWVADYDWVSLDDYVLAWKRVK